MDASWDMSFGVEDLPYINALFARVHLGFMLELPMTGDVFSVLNDALNAHCVKHGILHYGSTERAGHYTEVFWTLAEPSRDATTGRISLTTPRDQGANAADELSAELLQQRYVLGSLGDRYLIIGASSCLGQLRLQHG